jgi:hypothetical protein
MFHFFLKIIIFLGCIDIISELFEVDSIDDNNIILIEEFLKNGKKNIIMLKKILYLKKN